MKFVYYRNTKDRCAFEHEREAIEKADDEKEEVDFADFKSEVDGLDELATQLSWSNADELGGDWSISFYQSKYGGLPCRIMSTAECDFVFLQPCDMDMLSEIQSRGVTEKQWLRHTQFGKSGVDPR